MKENLNTKGSKTKLFKARRVHARNRRIVSGLLLFLAIALSFTLGFFFRSQIGLMTKLGVPVGEESSLNVSGSSVSATDKVTGQTLKSAYNSVSARIAEVEDILASNSFDSVNLDPATHAAIEAVMKNVNDYYAKYYNSEDYAKLVEDSQKNTYDGIGVLFSEVDGKVIAADVFSDSEADNKGVKKGDYVKSINGNYSDSWTFSEVTREISESHDSSIMITWGSSSSGNGKVAGADYTVTLDVSEMSEQNVTYELESNNVGYIKIRQFSDGVANTITDAVNNLTNSGATSFVIDVRDNPGGYMTSALDVAGLFVVSGTLVNIETKEETTARTTQGEIITTKPIVVLVNSTTAAAAEVFASALRDNSVATIVGQTTAGKGIVSATRELSFGGAIRYSAARYTTASGNPIQDSGIKPDVVISNSDYTGVEDNQLSIAILNASNKAG